MKTNRTIAKCLLLASLFLVACGKLQTTNESTMTSSTQTSSSSSIQVQDSSSTQTSGSKTTPASSSTETAGQGGSSSSAGTTQQSSVSMNVTAIAQGDFSTIAGTWVDDEGRVLTIEADGLARFAGRTRPAYITDPRLEPEGYVVAAHVRGTSIENSSSEVFIAVPAGTPDHYFARVEDKDRLIIGLGEEANYHPFYRQEEFSMTNPSPLSPTTTSSIDGVAISRGDFSTMAGTWVNDEGEVLTIEADGSTSVVGWTLPSSIENPRFKTEGYIVAHHVVGTSTDNYSVAVLIAVPAGIADHYFARVEDKDRLIIGQSVDANYHPFYRQ